MLHGKGRMWGTGTLAVRLAAAVGLGVPVMVATVVMLTGLATPGYDPVRWSISRLGEHGAAHAFVVNASLGTLGLALITTGWAARHRGIAGGTAIALAGTFLVLLALVPRDPGRPGITAVHRLLTVAAFACLTLPALLAGARGPERPRAFGAGVISLAAALLLLLLVPLILARLPMLGLWERFLAGVDLAWVMLCAVQLLRRPAGPG
jgi:hypothetical membrane protein